MPTHPSTHRANLAGILWMIAAMAAFSVEDVFIKHATRQLPVGEVLMLFGTGGAILFAFWARGTRAPLFTAQVLTRVMLIRAAFELIGRLFYILAVALTPLSSATAILQVTPILVVLGATLVFGETVGWRRWCAIAAGLVGVLIILRPSASDFSALSLLAVIGTVGFAGRDLASRAAPLSLTTPVLGVYGFLTQVLAGGLYTLWDSRALVVPTTGSALALAAATGAGIFAYSALMKAMRTGSISAVTPYRYTRLLFGMGLGAAVFGERPDGPMVLGALVIVAAGLALWWQGRRAGLR